MTVVDYSKINIYHKLTYVQGWAVKTAPDFNRHGQYMYSSSGQYWSVEI
jgi:hypothetical protein